jgi:hypothetical protein
MKVRRQMPRGIPTVCRRRLSCKPDQGARLCLHLADWRWSHRETAWAVGTLEDWPISPGRDMSGDEWLSTNAVFPQLNSVATVPGTRHPSVKLLSQNKSCLLYVMLFYTAKLGRTSIRVSTLAFGLCSWSLVEIHGRGLLHVLTYLSSQIFL